MTAASCCSLQGGLQQQQKTPSRATGGNMGVNVPQRVFSYKDFVAGVAMQM
eukprot:CAMPEP_0174378948 /NCGR_PEP_ID=MMETSP0811_2-20130205/122384_1 /TAXON_ID=73025 ORGANISM="Eutreptiella gymnastica-like, Strain CCMP1594" /NCGR_SAMPLE_ID=MMETSP0811_2 /ASSEMBLY_ACC=CAM_ASM_000667 /LENGTH=50 /DNA_ID=CAMNT_0015531321 /DNA_START=916 /DNA_END=1068 /DNA_ORIENTATION=+